jgi:hypothetical protein
LLELVLSPKGDFYQLPPVKAQSLLKPNTKAGIGLWIDLFSMVEFTQIMRQRDDQDFAELLMISLMTSLTN